MSGILVDSNILLDVFVDDPEWADWSLGQLEKWGDLQPLYINPIIYAEISIGFLKIETLEEALAGSGFRMIQIPKEALFLAGKVFLQYRKKRGTKTTTLPDFFIGAHAAVAKLSLLTRDIRRYKTYFPTVELIYPLEQ